MSNQKSSKSYNPAQVFSNWMINDTLNYQKKYHFDAGQTGESTHNNEADAFKHAYMQTKLALLGGRWFAQMLGNQHENSGNKNGQPQGESNMDLWNNEQGRDIAKELIQEYGILVTIPSKSTNDIIAEKVMQRLKAGKLITNPNDKRSYKQLKKNRTTGFAAPVQNNNHIFTREEIGNMNGDEFVKNEKLIMDQVKQGLIK